jgi:hypothetical protein
MYLIKSDLSMSDKEYKALYSLFRRDTITVLPFPSDVYEAQKMWNQYSTYAMEITSVKQTKDKKTNVIGYSVNPCRYSFLNFETPHTLKLFSIFFNFETLSLNLELFELSTLKFWTCTLKFERPFQLKLLQICNFKLLNLSISKFERSKKVDVSKF